jgi:hypothetical protein
VYNYACEFVVYTPTGMAFTVDVRELQKSEFNASWFDPVLGSYNGFAFQRDLNRTFATFTSLSSGAHDDWVLILKA